MGQKVATLEIGFEMTTAGAVSQMAALGSAVEKTSAAAVRQLDSIEQAVGTAIDTAPAIERLAKLTGATTSSAAAQVREYNRIERAGESLSAQLERQASVYGKTSTEIRQMKVETAALAAEQSKQTELAARLRAQEADLYAMEIAAARQARLEQEALADERAAAAARAVEDAAREASAIRDAAIAHQLFQARVREGVAAMEAEAEATASTAAAAARLRAMIDPAGVAQERFNAELAEARGLMSAGAISAAELAKAEELIAGRAAQAAAAMKGSVVSAGASRAGMQQLSFQLNDVATSYAGGIAPMTIFAQQASQVTQAVGLMAGEAKGFIGFIGGPWGAILTAATVVLGPMVAKLFEGGKAADGAAIAYDTLTDATKALDEATGRAHRSKEQEIADSIRATKTKLSEAVAERTLLAAKLAAFNQRINDPNAIDADTGAAFGAAFGASRVTGQIEANAAAIAAAEKAIRGADFVTIQNNVAASIDKVAAATERYHAVETVLGEAVASNKISQADANKQLQAAAERLETVKNADKTAAAASREHKHDLTEQAKAHRDAARAAQEHADHEAELTQAIGAQREAIATQIANAPALKPARVDLTGVNTQAIDQYMSALGPVDQSGEMVQHQIDLWHELADSIRAAADDLGNGFGRAGQSIGAATSNLLGFHAAQAQATEAHNQEIAKLEAIAKINGDSADIDRENARFRRASAEAQVRVFGDMAEAAQGFFKKGSAGYKALGAAEKAYRAVELAMAIENAAEQIGLIGARTAAVVTGNVVMAGADTARSGIEKANSLSTTAVKAVESVVNAIRSLPFPANIAAGAATAAAIAALGVAAVGGFGGGGKNTLPAANDGTGTVLGDSSAKSDSIKRSIDLLSDVDRMTMSYSAQMATSLKSIDSHIGNLSSLIVRIGGADGLNASEGVQTGFKSNLAGKIGGSTVGGAALGAGVAAGAIGAFGTFTALGAAGGPIGIAVGAALGAVLSPVIKSLFGTKTKVVGSGIYGGAQSLEDILSSGYDADYYSDVQKKKKSFGFTTSTKYSTQYADADPQLGQQFALILKSFDDAITAAAGPLGAATGDIEDRLNGFVVSIGKIDTKDLSGEQIQEKLEAVFGAAADGMAAAAFPGLEKFQQVGEGAFETLVRVSSTVEAVTTDLGMLGLNASKLSVDAKMAISGLFDSVDDMNSATSAYFTTYFTDAEQTAVKTQQLSKAFTSLGVALPDSIANYRKLVEAQDLTTSAGQSTYAALIQLAPAFAEITTAVQDATSASAILRERQDLEHQLLEEQGDTAALRKLELNGLDASNRSIQEQIYALRDQKAATDAAAQAATAAANAAAEAARLQDQAAAAFAQAQQRIADERSGLMDQLWQAQGDTASIRAAQLAKTATKNQDVLKQLWAVQDATAAQAVAQAAAEKSAQDAQQAADKAAQAADQLRDAWKSVAEGIMDEVDRIRGVMTTGPQSYASLLSQFDAATALARTGDQDAAKSLPELSKALLDAAEQAATSQQELMRIQGSTASSLEKTAAMVSALSGNTAAPAQVGFGATTLTAQKDWDEAFQASAAVVARASNDNLGAVEERASLEGIRAAVNDSKDELVNVLTQLAAAQTKVADILSRAEKLGEGDGLAVSMVERAA